MNHAHSRLGTELSRNEQQYVKSAYTHRFTGDNKPVWAYGEWEDGKQYPLQFKDDADWLAHTYFPINKDGTVNRRQSADCYSTPTWPNNPEFIELRKNGPTYDHD